MWACGTHPLKPHRGHLPSAWQSSHFRCAQSPKHSWPLSSMQGPGECKKPQWDMVFLWIAPNLAIRCKWVFGLTAMWAYPHKAHLPILGEVAWKLMLLANESPNWPYAYAWMNDTMSHMPLSSEGHIGIMTDGIPSINACGSLEGMELAIPDLMATSSQVPQHVVMPENIPSIVTHSPSLPTVQKTPEVASISPAPQSQAPPVPIQQTCQIRCSNYKGRWMQPWSGCSWLRPPWTPTKESWC